MVLTLVITLIESKKIKTVKSYLILYIKIYIGTYIGNLVKVPNIKIFYCYVIFFIVIFKCTENV